MASNLKEAFSQTPPNRSRKRPVCNVGQLISEHPEGKVISEVVSDLRWSVPAIQKTLISNGIENVPSATSFRNHRGGRCACFGYSS